ncbi:MAG: YHYH protein, partial [Pseudomonadales bacterium]|nr:YHYH protein [Pseudomonadales bacterium]
NGVPFDPAAAEWYKGIRNDQWQYEALSGAVSLGIDDNYAHVQPTGAYHYHGMPTALLRELSLLPARHSPLVGWAADGFPVYAKYGFVDALDENAGIRELTSSWRLRKGQRPYDKNTPGGYYDGTFTGDYVFQAGAGDLDECNGRFTVTPEFPLGTYAYFLTENWPVIPRCWKGEPSRDFDRKGLR